MYNTSLKLVNIITIPFRIICGFVLLCWVFVVWLLFIFGIFNVDLSHKH